MCIVHMIIMVICLVLQAVRLTYIIGTFSDMSVRIFHEKQIVLKSCVLSFFSWLKQCKTAVNPE